MRDLRHTTAHYASGASGASGARAANGAAVVVVDAFRASATICVLVSMGAKVAPFASVEEARVAPADFRVGERGGEHVAGFDFGNSPTGILDSGLPPGATVAMTTSNGTRVVEAAEDSSAVVVGSFVNASSVARWFTRSGLDEISVVGCGWRGHRASEDEAASAVILENLQNLGANLDQRAAKIVEINQKRPRKSLQKNTAAKRLVRLGYGRDLAFCLADDTVPVVPILTGGAFVGATGDVSLAACPKLEKYP